MSVRVEKKILKNVEGGAECGFLRAGLAKVVHHDVECGEEGVRVDHESVAFPSGIGIGKPTLDHGHLPIKIRTGNSHQAFKPLKRSPSRKSL